MSEATDEYACCEYTVYLSMKVKQQQLFFHHGIYIFLTELIEFNDCKPQCVAMERTSAVSRLHFQKPLLEIPSIPTYLS